MLRFDLSTREPVRNYFSRREQLRLLLLVMSLGVVLFVMRELRQPERAERVAKVFTENSAVASKDEENLTAEDSNQVPAESANLVLQIPPELLNSVKDNSYFRNAEKDAWFGLLAALQQASIDEITSGSVGDVSYVQLVDQPAAYRGRLVTVRGTLRQATQQKPAENDLGLQTYYRLVIQPSAGEVLPIFVYALELPVGVTTSEDVANDVSATGYFFKNLSYPWRDGLGIAPVILAKQVTLAEPSVAAEPLAAMPRTPTGSDIWDGGSDATESGVPTAAPELREVLSLAGWDRERFAAFEDDALLTDNERTQLLELLWRVRTFDAISVEAWARMDPTVAKLTESPASHRGMMVRLTGRVKRAHRHQLPADDAVRLEMPSYTTCEIETEHGRAVVVAANVPAAWQWKQTLDEPVSVSGVFVKRLSDEVPIALLVAKRVEWHPTTPQGETVSFGESILGSLGMDVGLLDEVESRGRIRSEEHDAFYTMLQAAGKIGANQLARFAQGNLSAVRDHWAAEAERTEDEPRHSLAHEVVRRAAEGRYSVAPLFNDAERHIGELVVVDGAARRVVRVNMASRLESRDK